MKTNSKRRFKEKVLKGDVYLVTCTRSIRRIFQPYAKERAEVGEMHTLIISPTNLQRMNLMPWISGINFTP